MVELTIYAQLVVGWLQKLPLRTGSLVGTATFLTSPLPKYQGRFGKIRVSLSTKRMFNQLCRSQGGRRDAAVGGPSSPYRIEESCPAPWKGRSISWRWPPVTAGGPSHPGTSRTSAPCSKLPGQERGGGTSLN